MRTLAGVLEVLAGLITYFSSLNYGCIAFPAFIDMVIGRPSWDTFAVRRLRLVDTLTEWGVCLIPALICIALALLIRISMNKRDSSFATGNE